MDALIHWDARLFLMMHDSWHHPVTDLMMYLITFLGNGWVTALILIPLLWIWNKEKFKKHLAILVFAAALGGVIVHVMKIAIGRDRPVQYFSRTSDVERVKPYVEPWTTRSFPSGHTQTAFTLAFLLCFIHPSLTLLWWILAVLVGLSRIYLGVHFPLDVLAGACIGVLCGWFAYALFLRRKESKGNNSGRSPPG
jgi:undecaprenyl-diphosphatase